MEDGLIAAITKEAMLAALHCEPEFSEMFVAYLLTRNSRVEEDLIEFSIRARLLLLLANFGKEGSPRPIAPDIRQETLAEMTRTTRSRVSFLHDQIPQTRSHQLQQKRLRFIARY